MELKENDVFEFKYNEEYRKKLFEPYHCFDGTLIVRNHSDGKQWLEDTFWSSGGGKVFTLEDAQEKGTLTFLCNLNEVEKISKDDERYYNDEDVIKLSIHHGYRNEYRIKPGTQRSQTKMIQTINEAIEKKEREVKSLQYYIEKHKEDLEKVMAGDTTIYI